MKQETFASQNEMNYGTPFPGEGVFFFFTPNIY